MNSIKILFLFPLFALSNLALGADSYGGKQGDYGLPNQANGPGRTVYDSVAKLKGDWVLAPAAQQEGGATKKGPAAKIIGTDKTAMSFKLVGKGTTVQESLLPDTPQRNGDHVSLQGQNLQHLGRHTLLRQKESAAIASRHRVTEKNSHELRHELRVVYLR